MLARYKTRQWKEGSLKKLANVDSVRLLMLNDEDSTQYAEWVIHHVMCMMDYVNDEVIMASCYLEAGPSRLCFLRFFRYRKNACMFVL